jgi:putative FmdB family regulatory protein
VPMYEFRCRACGSTFVETRPMSGSSDPATCPAGHDDTVRLLSLAGVTGLAKAPASNAGACCGGGCCS